MTFNSSLFFLAVPAPLSWAVVVSSCAYNIQHSACCRGRPWLHDLFRSLHGAFDNSNGAYSSRLPHSCLCDAAFLNTPLEDGRVCSCPSSMEFPIFSGEGDIGALLLRARNAVGLACNADRKPDRLTLFRLNEA